MCGITGKVFFRQTQGTPLVEPDLLRRMNAALFHRGPDQDGKYFSEDGSIALAMRRLKIIDLSSGQQPLYNEAKDVVVFLNGEIYNYIELRQELQSLGHQFRTQSDTEVLAHGYEEWQLDLPKKLNGMFGFAIYDMRKNKLILGRDRMGIKPLYYWKNARALAFASELKALLVDPEIPQEIDAAALDDYFSLLYVPTPRSIFKGIRKLPAGHLLILNLETGATEEKPYWHFPLQQNPSQDLGWPHYKEQMDQLFRDAIRLQLRSDVPSGVFLSSGLDSSAIAYYASQLAQHPLETFTIYFKELSYSERADAKLISSTCNTRHHEQELNYNVEELIHQTAKFFDEPFADTSAIPTYLLCGFAKERITVALSGEGGDELFAGYPTYQASLMARHYLHLPQFLRKQIQNVLSKLDVSWERISWEFKLKEFVRGAEQGLPLCHYAWKEIFSEQEKNNFYRPEFLKLRDTHRGWDSFAALLGNNPKLNLAKLLWCDQQTYLLDQFLVKSDRMSMAHALEVRVPILDHRIVEFAAMLPAHYKLRGHKTKWALRELLRGKLPKSILSGPKKGFSPPLPHWIATSLRPFFAHLLRPESLEEAGWIKPETGRILLEEHWSKKRDHHRRIWTLANFVLWKKNWGKN